MLRELAKPHLKKLKLTLLFKIIILLVFFFYLFYFFTRKYNLSKYIGNETTINGIIKNIQKKDNKITLIVKGKENILVNYYLSDDGIFDYKLGDKVVINGNMTIPSQNTNFNLFNYRKYLLTKKIYYTFKAKKVEKVKDNKNILYNIKQKLIDRANSTQTSSYIKSLILGDSTSIDSDVSDSYKSNGISHLFAISGMHITFLTAFILKILNKINKKKIINQIIVIIFLVFYSFITSFSISIIRASLMFILGSLFKIFKLKMNSKEIFLMTLIITLFINPFYVYSASFKYSFTICFYLIMFSDLIKENKHYISKLFMTSLIAFLVSIPIQINTYNSVNFLSVFFSIFFIPFFTFLIFPLSLITFIFPFISSIFNIFINIFESISLFVSKINFLTFDFATTPIYVSLFYYFVITICLINLKKKKYFSFIVFFLCLFFHYHINIFKMSSEVTMLDVGQGDSLLISLKHNKGNILIDTGGINNYYGNSYSISEKVIIPYLKSVGIRKLDYLILSHGDYDHMGEAINLVKNFKVKNVVFNTDGYNELESQLIKVLDTQKIKYYKGLDEININNTKLLFLNTNNLDNENDNSNVIYVNLEDYNFLFMGDAGEIREKNILDEYNLTNIDFLKVGHHGSNTSSSKNFIDKIKPKNCLISVGKNNRYGHPKQSVIDTLASYCDIYRTDLNGIIKIKLLNNNYKLKTNS